jgi:8-oxo-dGTP pyrophosphatase MutT (NUDIX family)
MSLQHVLLGMPGVYAPAIGHNSGSARRTVVMVTRTPWGLLVVRKNALDAAPREFICPQGGVHKGENDDQAVLRELREELAIEPWCIFGSPRYLGEYLSLHARGGPKLLVGYQVEVTPACRVRLSGELKDWRLVRCMDALRQVMLHASPAKQAATRFFINRAGLPSQWGLPPSRDFRPR